MSLQPATGAHANVSLGLREHAARAPDRPAVRVFGRGARTIDYGALERRVDALAHGLAVHGFARGDRVSLFVHPGIELVALFHALLRLGAVPVLIDAGLGRAALLDCIQRARPRGLIGVPKVHVARALFPRAFASVELAVAVGPALGLRAAGLESLVRGHEDRAFPVTVGAANDPAAVLFTSGSTGPPKGVVYTHGMFADQIRALRELYSLEPGEVDAACFPLFALFDHALGMTTAFPDLDPSRPGACDPERVVRAIEESRATFAFGSPAIWRRVLPWMRQRSQRFTTLRRIAIAGAPVPTRLVVELAACLPDGGEVHTPYGATEALPVTNLAGADLTETRRAKVDAGEGTCIGRPVGGIELELIKIIDEPIERWDDSLRVAPGEPGEICVRGARVTREYLLDEKATRAAKIPSGLYPWHRMGDVGRFDEDGVLWFLGRKSHRLETERGLLMPVGVENVFERCPGVKLTALVGVGLRGRERPHLVVEPERGVKPRDLESRLRAHAADTAAAKSVRGFLFHRSLPVDVRHNAKIDRTAVKRWAERQFGPRL